MKTSWLPLFTIFQEADVSFHATLLSLEGEGEVDAFRVALLHTINFAFTASRTSDVEVYQGAMYQVDEVDDTKRDAELWMGFVPVDLVERPLEGLPLEEVRRELRLFAWRRLPPVFRFFRVSLGPETFWYRLWSSGSAGRMMGAWDGPYDDEGIMLRQLGMAELVREWRVWQEALDAFARSDWSLVLRATDLQFDRVLGRMLAL